MERLVIGDRSSQVPRKEYCRQHGIGLSTLDRYLQQWHRRQSRSGKEVPAEGRLVAVELAGVASVPAVSIPVRRADTKSSEASFRALKSELSVRPLYHQLEPRVKAHILVAFLGYALWVTLKHLLKRQPPVVPTPSASGVDNAQPMTPMRAIALLSTLQSADIVLSTSDGREIRLRRIPEPTAEQKSLLRQLGISLPEHLRFQRECSADWAVA
ncbi:MAG: hypothetical protein ACYCOX_08755 [Acidobacteriaceae bacterium]